MSAVSTPLGAWFALAGVFAVSVALSGYLTLAALTVLAFFGPLVALAAVAWWSERRHRERQTRLAEWS